MKWEIRNSDGTKSIDRKISKLVAYVNNHVKHMTDEESAINWSQKVIEEGVIRIASRSFANRIE